MAETTDYQKIGETLFESIVANIKQGKLKEGEQLPPIRRFAEEHNIPLRLAYSIFTQLRNAGLVKTVHGAGTFVSVDPSSSSPHTKKRRNGDEVYIILQTHPYLPFPMTRQLINELQSHGYVATVIVENSGSQDNILQMLEKRWQKKPPAAVVMEGRNEQIDQLVLRMISPDIPVVATFRHPRFIYPGWHSVQLDIAGAHYLATRKLLKEGCTRIGLTLKKHTIDSNKRHIYERSWVTNSLCLKGANRAVLDSGLGDVLSIVMFEKSKSWEEDSVPDEIQEKMVAYAVEWLKQNSHVRAFVGLEPWLWYIKTAASILNLRIPEDLKLVGIGKAPMWFRGEYACLDWNLGKIAKEIAQIVITSEGDSQGNANRHVLIQPEWVDLSRWNCATKPTLSNQSETAADVDLRRKIRVVEAVSAAVSKV